MEATRQDHAEDHTDGQQDAAGDPGFSDEGEDTHDERGDPDQPRDDEDDRERR